MKNKKKVHLGWDDLLKMYSVVLALNDKFIKNSAENKMKVKIFSRFPSSLFSL